VVGWRVFWRVKGILGIPWGKNLQEVWHMLDGHSARLVRLGRQIADLEHARRFLPAGFTWTGDALIATLRAEKARLENLVAMPDLARAGRSEPESEEEHEIPAAERAAPVEAGRPQSNGIEAAPDLPPEPEAATDALLEAATPRDGEPEDNSVGQQKSAVAAEPVSFPLPSDSGASDNPASDNDPPNGGDVSDVTLIAFIRDKCGGKVKPRDLQRRNGKRWPDAPSARAKLSELVHAGLLEWVDGEEGETARPKNAPAGP
jgi:hypothetical protein